MVAEVDYTIVRYTGFVVGWLLVTYGLLLWAAGDIPGLLVPLRHSDGVTRTRYAVGYPFAFVTTGIAFILIASRELHLDPILGTVVELLGYLIIASIGTAIFLARLHALLYASS